MQWVSLHLKVLDSGKKGVQRDRMILLKIPHYRTAWFKQQRWPDTKPRLECQVRVEQHSCKDIHNRQLNILIAMCCCSDLSISGSYLWERWILPSLSVFMISSDHLYFTVNTTFVTRCNNICCQLTQANRLSYVRQMIQNDSIYGSLTQTDIIKINTKHRLLHPLEHWSLLLFSPPAPLKKTC